MWSSTAAVLAVFGVAAAFMVGEDEEPLALSPRAAALTAVSAIALLTAATLSLTGLASWWWTGEAAGWSGILGFGRYLYGGLGRTGDDGIEPGFSSAPDDEPAVPAPPDRLPDAWQILPRR
jgi:hypothetical protein